jgi:hypothetical protein
MNKHLSEIYRASRPKEALASQDQFQSANALLGSDVDKFAELLVKKCAYLVNDYQRTTGYTDYAKMLCREFNIPFKDEDYFGPKE